MCVTGGPAIFLGGGGAGWLTTLAELGFSSWLPVYIKQKMIMN